jgi:hypothetical protein
MASGMLNSSRLVGGSIGLAVLSTVTGDSRTAGALTDDCSAALLTGGALIAIGALSCLTIPSNESAEYIDIMSCDAWQLLDPALTDALAAVDVAAGPVIDLGAGTGLGALTNGIALPRAEIVAVEPSAGLRAVLLSKLVADPVLAHRVTVLDTDVQHAALSPPVRRGHRSATSARRTATHCGRCSRGVSPPARRPCSTCNHRAAPSLTTPTRSPGTCVTASSMATPWSANASSTTAGGRSAKLGCGTNCTAMA